LVSAKAAGGGKAIKGSLRRRRPTRHWSSRSSPTRPATAEGERYLGAIKAVDRCGRQGGVRAVEVAGAPRGASITATVTTSGGASSAFSKPVVLGR
jgi:hypothetical protein